MKMLFLRLKSNPVFILIFIVTLGLGMFYMIPGKGNEQKTFKMANPYYSRTDTQKLEVSHEQWKKFLNEEVYHVAFEKGTEHAFSGKYWNYDGKGTYYCAVCGNKLFESDAKFASSCGWPSFFKPDRKDAVVYHDDFSFGMSRTEVNCGRCGAHLGHVFNDGPKPTGLRYCMNSRVLEFEPDTVSK